MSTTDRKRENLRKSFHEVDTEIFRTDRDRRVEKSRRKKALSRFERRAAKNIRTDDDET